MTSDDDEGRASEQQQRRGASYDDDDEEQAMATMSEYWGFFGLVLVQRLRIGFFFFFFDKHNIGVCFAFALYKLYWGLVFSAFSTNNMTMGTVGLISDSLCCFFFFF